MYGSPTTKEIKKKHSSRPVGGAETGRWDREDSQQGSSWRTQQGGRLWSGVGKAVAGSEAAAGRPCDRARNPEFQHREIKPQTTD